MNDNNHSTNSDDVDPIKEINPQVKQINIAVNESLKDLSGKEKSLWYKYVSKLAWNSLEKSMGEAPNPDGLKKVRDLSCSISPNEVPTRFLEELIFRRRLHPGHPKTKLDGNDQNLLRELASLVKLSLTDKDVNILDEINSKYVGIPSDKKAEFIARDFDTKADADEFIGVYDDFLNTTGIIKTKDERYVAFSYDTEDYPPFLALLTLRLAGCNIDDKKVNRAIRNEYTQWEEQTGRDYWEDAVRLSMGVSLIKNDVELDSKSVERFMADNIRRDDPALQDIDI